MTGDVAGAAATPTPTRTPTPVGRDGRARIQRIGRPLLAVLLIGGWLAWAGVTYVTQAREVSAAQYAADLDARDVVAFRVVANVRDGDSVWGGAPLDFDVPPADQSGMPDPDSPDRGSTTVMYWTDNAIGPVRIVDDYSVPVQQRVAELQQAGVRPNTSYDYPSDTGQGVGFVVGLVALLVVVGGPVPTRGTRWFWFWMLGVTWGWGVVAYAVFELLRPGRTPRVVGVGGASRRRLRGWEGWVLMILLSVLVGVGVGELSGATGGVVIPAP
jgi:hypothetical protein